MGNDSASDLNTGLSTLSTPPIQPANGLSGEPTPSELERLRDILYGPQSRTTDKRLSDLDGRLETTRREWTTLLDEKTSVVADSAAAQVNTARKDLSARLDQQASDQQAQLKATHKELAERLAQQDAQQAAQLQATHKALADRLEQLATDLLNELRASHKELSDRLEAINADHTERLRVLQTEARSRDETLRQDLLALTGALEHRKTSRQELSQLFVELSQRLRSE